MNGPELMKSLDGIKKGFVDSDILGEPGDLIQKELRLIDLIQSVKVH